MLNYQCECGEIRRFGSMPPNPCEPCDKCNSVPTLDRSHREPMPHDFSSASVVQTDEGEKTLTRCRLCHRSKAEIEKEAASGKEGPP